jgi:hypothetical protein
MTSFPTPPLSQDEVTTFMRSDNFDAKRWLQSEMMTSVCWHHTVENAQTDRCRSMRRHKFSMRNTYVRIYNLREFTYRSNIFSNSDVCCWLGHCWGAKWSSRPGKVQLQESTGSLQARWVEMCKKNVSSRVRDEPSELVINCSAVILTNDLHLTARGLNFELDQTLSTLPPLP